MLSGSGTRSWSGSTATTWMRCAQGRGGEGDLKDRRRGRTAHPLQTNIPQIDVQVNLEEAQKYGIKPGDVRRAMAALVATEEIGDLYQRGRIFDVQVWSTPETRTDVTRIQTCRWTPRRRNRAVGEIAEVAIKPTPNLVQHENLSEASTSAATSKAATWDPSPPTFEQNLSKVDFPLVPRRGDRGDHRTRNGGQPSAMDVVAIVVSSFCMPRSRAFAWRRGHRHPPVALVGGVMAAYFGGEVVSLGSLVGFLTTRHRRAQQHSADQPLPAPRTLRRREVRSELVLRGAPNGCRRSS